MTSKVCTKCGESKPLAEFYAHKSGRQAGKPTSFCKECGKARSRSYYDAHKKERIAYQVAYKEANPEKRAAYSATWYAANSEKHAATVVAYQTANPEKRSAHNAVNNAVQRGDIPPAWTMVCEVCQEAQSAHWHHHNGYDEEHRLDVVAVCTHCHGKEHRTNG